MYTTTNNLGLNILGHVVGLEQVVESVVYMRRYMKIADIACTVNPCYGPYLP
jgi:hypothetical protein